MVAPFSTKKYFPYRLKVASTGAIPVVVIPIRIGPFIVERNRVRVLLPVLELITRSSNAAIQHDAIPRVAALPNWHSRPSARLLSRVVQNLVGNALDYSQPGGTVALGVQAASGIVRLSVADACAGIPDADLARVFDPGWRADPARTRSCREGSTAAGIGLTIVKAVTEAHGGQVSLTNTPTGCLAIVELPAAA